MEKFKTKEQLKIETSEVNVVWYFKGKRVGDDTLKMVSKCAG